MASISELDFETGVFVRFSVFARKSSKLSCLKNTMDYFLDLFSMITTSEVWKNLNSIHPDLL
ncbi:hypothetical protein EHQ58_10160 [Leptospira ognonensis]|uniref:Uncharacterized protein n=1 Tax=Leptospira ognonensis TaxID=2484945 RepID=A0A4R9K1I8_9LEPT|nr:hypothetical protein [Leptospira ognonensis]TGL58674.1 hypothetical protein EHQ58_10160 [Leptospira ognonensis]